jgi:CubicO group peptidase (beta-lactamase class C family)
MPARFAAILILTAICAGAAGAQMPAAPDPMYYPTNGWRESTPEAQGIDSAALAAIVDNIAAKKRNVHSMLVIRHGYVVLDAYFYPYNPAATHDVASVSKSITAAITGIAVDQGLVKVDQPVLSYFPDESPADPDPRTKRITVGNLLSMQAGLDCGFLPGEQELERMRRTNQWVKFTLGLAVKYDPGTKFGYCSPGYHLLSAIVSHATHQTLADFGRKNLFEPLGIHDVAWPSDEQGRTHGWGNSHFYPRDFAKIGYLYLHGGRWDGKQIVSEQWVRDSITRRADPGRGPDAGYGYGWWLDKVNGIDEFGGNGRGGQKVAVWAEKDMIVVVTGGGYPAAEVGPPIAAAVKSSTPLPENPDAVRLLKARVAQVVQAPAPTAPAELPATAARISGAMYEFPRNASRIDGLQLSFAGNAEARLKVKYLGTELSFPVGLDGVYRLGPWGPLGLLAGAAGRWTSGSDFLLDLNFISNINRYTLALHFDGDRIQAVIDESSGLVRDGHVEGKRIPGDDRR